MYNNNFDDFEYFVEWRPVMINGIVTNYLVSSDGQVKSHFTNIILKSLKNPNGYLKVAICLDKKIHQKSIHRLVANAFIPNDDPEHKTQVNHINGIKTDNRVENLEWVTSSENIQHAFNTGLKHPVTGSKVRSSKFNEDKVHLVCKLLEKNIPRKLIVYLINITYSAIEDIVNKNSWTDISSLYYIDPNFDSRKKQYKQIKYKKLKEILIELDIFDKIDLSNLLYSKHITHKQKLIGDLEDKGYEIFIDKELENEFNKDYGDEEEDYED